MIAQGAPRTLRAAGGSDARADVRRRRCADRQAAVLRRPLGRGGTVGRARGACVHVQRAARRVRRARFRAGMRDMRRFVDMRVDKVLARLLAEADRLDAPVAAGRKASGAATAGGVPDAAAASLARSVALAVANALSCRLNAPAALEARGFGVTAPVDRSFLRPEDGVALIGAGMLLEESAAVCASVDVVDMRPRAALQSGCFWTVTASAAGPARCGSTAWRPPRELVARADVVGITGCALENGSLFDIVRLPRRAREFVVFGPSAQAPMELAGHVGRHARGGQPHRGRGKPDGGHAGGLRCRRSPQRDRGIRGNHARSGQRPGRRGDGMSAPTENMTRRRFVGLLVAAGVATTGTVALGGCTQGGDAEDGQGQKPDEASAADAKHRAPAGDGREGTRGRRAGEDRAHWHHLHGRRPPDDERAGWGRPRGGCAVARQILAAFAGNIPTVREHSRRRVRSMTSTSRP